MPIIDEEKEKRYWDSWLDPAQGLQLDEIRGAVRRLHDDSKKEPPLPFFTPHGPDHNAAVERLLHRLIPMENYSKLRRMERFCLLAAAWLHDIGMYRTVAKDAAGRVPSDDEIRTNHHCYSETFVSNSPARCGLLPEYATAVGLLTKYHRRKEDIGACHEKIVVLGEEVRLRLLAAYLRLADALDISSERVPDEAYAICLAYDIPNEVKLHWIKSKLVNGIHVNPDSHDITVQFRIPYPQDLGTSVSQEWTRGRVQSIEALVCDDLREELLSVQNILRKDPEGLPFYLDVQADEFEARLDAQLLNDLRELITNYDIMIFPTASKLIDMILITAANITGFSLNQKGGPVPIKEAKEDPNRLRRVDEFLATAREQLLKNRPSHLGVKRLFETLNEAKGQLKDESTGTEQYAERINTVYREHALSKQHVRGHAADFLKSSRSNRGVSGDSLNILLYGNSELVTKALCGFRDTLLAENGQENPLGVCNSIVEREASQRMRLFVCEAQPKTQTAVGDRLTYHDGAQYGLHLKRHGFTDIILIPDVVAGHIIEHVPIDLVVLGADGVTPDYFMHSAGHASIVNLAREFRERAPAVNRNAMKILLVTSHQKWADEVEPEAQRLGLTSDIGESDGCYFWRGLNYELRSGSVHEHSREHPWITRDAVLQRKLRQQSIAFFNPKRDRIPIHHVDFIITDRGWKSVQDPAWKDMFSSAPTFPPGNANVENGPASEREDKVPREV
jgi:translation initiation factor 2B subunit (eIF-2B alpha/beta/delta family)